jgi:hypothetical protein
MPKWLKFILALLLLPVCAGEAQALGRVLLNTGGADTTWIPLLAGLACWFVIFLLLPKPMWLYVFGHEFTHALWTWLFGGQVKQMKVSSGGGHVVVSKNNFLIVLAPYFFPFYAVLVVLLFGLGDLIWDWRPYLVWFHLALGASSLTSPPRVGSSPPSSSFWVMPACCSSASRLSPATPD